MKKDRTKNLLARVRETTDKHEEFYVLQGLEWARIFSLSPKLGKSPLESIYDYHLIRQRKDELLLCESNPKETT